MPHDREAVARPPSAAELAAAVKAFRAREGCNVARAAELLGIPARTIEGIEQGRGYRHPMLILLALRSFE